MPSYDHQSVEKKWQQRWEENSPNHVEKDSAKPKRYVLDMFPYPSGAGLHIGHPEGYTATDILSRYLRMQGYNVLHPMGWDAFGLPAENYAIKTGVHPSISTTQNINNFRRQIKSIGLSYDWSREISTCDPTYYKWSQWMFLELYKNGLAYKKKAPVNWCEKDQTVLANEQVVDGCCERCGTPVIQKELSQWFFGITKFADRLLAGLEKLDWPEKIKSMQKNWIGKSVGVRMLAKVKDTNLTVETFSAHFEAAYADTFVVIAPDHPLLPDLVKGLPNEKHVLKRAEEILTRQKDERFKEVKEYEGEFTGRYIVDPLGNGDLPIWISSFALSNYGTGIVKCSAHDERDFAFAKKYQVPLKVVLLPKDPDERANVLSFEKCFVDAEHGYLSEPTGFGKQTAKEERQKMLEHLVAKGFAVPAESFRLRDWLVSRQRYWGAPIPVVYDPEGNAHAVKMEHLPLLLPVDVDYAPKGTSPIGSSKSYVELAEKLYGAGWRFETDTMDGFVDSSWYFLRYCDPNNATVFADRANIDYWCPVDMYVGGAEHAVLHLLYARFFTYALHDFGYVNFEEPFLALRNQGLILGPDGQKMSKSKGNTINPDEIVLQFGADALRLYEMFMAPFEDVKPWDPNGITGVRRFLDKVWNLKGKVGKTANDDLTKIIQKTIKKVGEDIVAFRFNTAISSLMICANAMQEAEKVSPDIFSTFLRLLAPFAPHISSELWEQAEFDGTIFDAWPKFDEAMIKEDIIQITVQVNGKVRATFGIAANASEDQVKNEAAEEVNVAKYLEGKELVKTIFVPGKLVNFVIKET